jgi:D-alanyl-D-alanine carboxypeptidase (penicillin-binding protein 5/6)
VSGSSAVQFTSREGWLSFVGVLGVLAVWLMSAPAVDAQREPLPFKPKSPYRAAALADASTGEILFGESERVPWPPASIVKLMTSLVAVEDVAAGKATLDDQVLVSANASKMGGSQVYLAEGERFALRDMLAATMIQSANDAAVAVAEHLGGSTTAYVERMNARAKELGMEEAEFHSVHGLPPAKGQKPDLVSARDLVILAREISKHPELMQWAGTREASFRRGEFGMHNPNHLLTRFPDATGLKTGFYGAAGFNVAATARRDGLDLIAIVLGSPSSNERFKSAADLLQGGFTAYKLLAPVRAGEQVGPQIAISGGRESFVVGIAATDLRMRMLRDEAQRTKVEVRVPTQVVAPIQKGQKLGEVVVSRGDEQVAVVDLVSPRDVAATSWWASLLE